MNRYKFIGLALLLCAGIAFLAWVGG